MKMSFKLEVFEGPLDLLLHLIAKHKLNINDIPIMILVEQYLNYISDMAEQDMEVAGDFLEMAARLIYIKTVSLLPRKEEAEALKKELEGRLIEYSLCKAAAEKMRAAYSGDTYAVRAPMKIETDSTYSRTHDPMELVKAYKGMEIKKSAKPEALVPNVFSKLVSRKFVSVSSKIVYVLRSERVAAFLAVLELTKSGRIILNEDNTEMTFNSAGADTDYDASSEWEERENEADR